MALTNCSGVPPGKSRSNLGSSGASLAVAPGLGLMPGKGDGWPKASERLAMRRHAVRPMIFFIEFICSFIRKHDVAREILRKKFGHDYKINGGATALRSGTLFTV